MKKKINNFSKSHQKYVKKLKKDKFLVIFFRIFILVAFLGLWELLTHFKVLDPFFCFQPIKNYRSTWRINQCWNPLSSRMGDAL